MNEKNLEDLKQSIDKLTALEERSSSPEKIFWRGVIYGFGFFVGSALLVALFVYLLSLFDTAPIIGEFISKINKAILEQSGK